mgnify:CR=1 FL=1
MKHLKKFESFQSMLDEIDNNNEIKYYVGYFKRTKDKKNYSWPHDGIYKGYSEKGKALKFIDDLKADGILDKDITIISKNKYDKLEKTKSK